MIEIFLTALKLGLTSFGGPVAHLGYFHREYVVRKRWLEEPEFADLVALCQALPGPASSQLGMAIGHLRGGAWGAVLAWVGFTLPSAVLMAGLAFWWSGQGSLEWVQGVVKGLSLVALAVVAQAVWTMGRRLLTGWSLALFAVACAATTALFPGPITVFAVLAGSAAAALLFVPGEGAQMTKVGTKKVLGTVCLVLFFVLLGVLPWAAVHLSFPLLSMADTFYRTGALVFGGGHVVLPLLQNELVPAKISIEAFLAGYGAVQAVPGPLFSLSSFLGFVMAGPTGALVAVTAIFLPSFLLVLGVLPFWNRLKANRWFRRALAGVNAAVVGLLAWALYDPVFLTAVHGPLDAVAALVLGLALGFRTPSWAVVLIGVALGFGLQAWSGA